MSEKVTKVEFKSGAILTLYIQLGERAGYTVSRDTVATFSCAVNIEQLRQIIAQTEQLIEDNPEYKHTGCREIVHKFREVHDKMRAKEVS